MNPTTYKAITGSYLNRNMGIIPHVVDALWNEAAWEADASFAVTVIEESLVIECMEAIKAKDATHTLSVGLRNKLMAIVRLINSGKAPQDYPPILEQWLQKLGDSTNVGNLEPPNPPPPPPVGSDSNKLNKTSVQLDKIVLESTQSLTNQASQLMRMTKAWAIALHDCAPSIVSTTRGLDGALLDIVIPDTTSAKNVGRMLLSGLMVVVDNSPSLKNRVPQAVTGRGLFVNILNTLVPPQQTMKARLILTQELNTTKYEDCAS